MDHLAIIVLSEFFGKFDQLWALIVDTFQDEDTVLLEFLCKVRNLFLEVFNVGSFESNDSIANSSESGLLLGLCLLFHWGF